MSLNQKLDSIVAKFNELEKKLQDPNKQWQNFEKIYKKN